MGKLSLQKIEEIIDTAPEKITMADITFAILCETIEDRRIAYKSSYKQSATLPNANAHYNSPKIAFIQDLIKDEEFNKVEHEMVTQDDITFEENKQALVSMISQIKYEMENGTIDKKDGMKMIVDIRTKLNDKFGTQDSNEEKHIIVVPSKFDYICPHTHKECYFPPESECIKRYNLIKK